VDPGTKFRDDDRESGNIETSTVAPASMTTAVDIRGVSKTFGSGAAAVHAFGPADLAIESGEFVSLLGPSGCGKSTLMLMIAGLLAPSAGKIHVNQDKVTTPRIDIGIMFQDNTLVPWRHVQSNIALQLRGLDPLAYQGKIADLLKSGERRILAAGRRAGSRT
jgi:NitT/TauT family transport system ATP-binding protein